jgi:methyltransferase (TIGR00027 family)
MTAYWIAAARARESGRRDALFVDRYAHALAGAEGFALLDRQERASGVSAFIPVRTRFVDDLVLSAATDGSVRQVGLLGAGLDTRAFRLALPEYLRWFECDRPDVFEVKERKLAELGASPVCNRRIVTGDLAGNWISALLDAGFDPDTPTLWLAEGLFFYLTEGGVWAVLRDTAEMTRAGGRLFADVTGTGVLRLPVMQSYLSFLQSQDLPEPYCSDDPAALMGKAGWAIERWTWPGQDDANYGRFATHTGSGDPTMRAHMVIARRGNCTAPRR